MGIFNWLFGKNPEKKDEEKEDFSPNAQLRNYKEKHNLHDLDMSENSKVEKEEINLAKEIEKIVGLPAGAADNLAKELEEKYGPKSSISLEKKVEGEEHYSLKRVFNATAMDNYAFDENWEENETLSLKVSEHFSNQFERKVWVNNEYITTSFTYQPTRRVHNINNNIDTSQYIIKTYVQLTNSNEIIIAYSPKEKYKDDIVREFLFLINLLSPNNDALKSMQNYSPQELKDLIFSGDEMTMIFSCNKSSHICLTNRNDCYYINLYPPKSIFEGLFCVKEGEW